MLFVHDVHVVMGEHEFAYEDVMREEYVPGVADDDTRVLWFLHSTHGSGNAYHIITITAMRDGAAWDRFVERQRYGDLSDVSTRMAALRYTLSSSLLVSTDWSPLRDARSGGRSPSADRPFRLAVPRGHPDGSWRHLHTGGSGIAAGRCRRHPHRHGGFPARVGW